MTGVTGSKVSCKTLLKNDSVGCFLDTLKKIFAAHL